MMTPVTAAMLVSGVAIAIWIALIERLRRMAGLTGVALGIVLGSPILLSLPLLDTSILQATWPATVATWLIGALALLLIAALRSPSQTLAQIALGPRVDRGLLGTSGAATEEDSARRAHALGQVVSALIDVALLLVIYWVIGVPLSNALVQITRQPALSSLILGAFVLLALVYVLAAARRAASTLAGAGAVSRARANALVAMTTAFAALFLAVGAATPAALLGPASVSAAAFTPEMSRAADVVMVDWDYWLPYSPRSDQATYSLSLSCSNGQPIGDFREAYTPPSGTAMPTGSVGAAGTTNVPCDHWQQVYSAHRHAAGLPDTPTYSWDWHDVQASLNPDRSVSVAETYRVFFSAGHHTSVSWKLGPSTAGALQDLQISQGAIESPFLSPNAPPASSLHAQISDGPSSRVLTMTFPDLTGPTERIFLVRYRLNAPAPGDDSTLFQQTVAAADRTEPVWNTTVEVHLPPDLDSSTIALKSTESDVRNGLRDPHTAVFAAQAIAGGTNVGISISGPTTSALAERALPTVTATASPTATSTTSTASTQRTGSTPSTTVSTGVGTNTPAATATTTRSTATATAAEVATATPTATVEATLAATPTEAATETPTATVEATLTATPTEAATETPTATPETPTPTPTEAPTDTPTATPVPPTETPTATPEPPTETPTVTPTASPTVESLVIPPAQGAGDTRFGIAEGFRNPSAMADTHANWERIVLSWSDVQPQGPADLSRLGQTITNTQVEGERARGVTLTGLLQFTPGWAQANPDRGQRSPPRNLNLPYDDPNNYWGQFVYQTVKFYAGRIDEWVIWNEPEFKPGDAGAGQSFTWEGSDADFAQLLKVAYLAAKKANPNAIVSFPGTSYWTDQNSGRAQFYDRVLRILTSDPDAPRLGFYHDRVSLNLYRTADDLVRVYDVYRQIQARYGIDKPIWLTESNSMPTDDHKLGNCDHSGDPIKTTMQEQAAYAVQAYAMAAAAGYERIGFYQMVDANPCVEPAVWGVVRDDGSKRPVEDSLRTAITNFRGFSAARFVPLARVTQNWPAWPDDPQSYTPNWQVYQVSLDKPGGRRVTVLWNGDGANPTAAAGSTLGNVQPPGGLVIQVPAHGSAAQAIDEFGQPYPYFSMRDGNLVVYLKPATATYSGDPPGYHFVGGDPVLILEDGVGPNSPVDPPQLVTATSSTTGAQADFQLAVNPAEGLTIQQGEAADFSVATQGLNGFNGPISLRISQWSTQRFPQPRSADSLPLGVTLPDSVAAGRSATLHIETSDQTDVGIYYLTVEAAGGGVTKTVDVALVVDPPGG